MNDKETKHKQERGDIEGRGRGET